MPARGQVYYDPSIKLPPGQPNPHMFVVVSAVSSAQFVNVVIIRSAINRSGARVRLVPGHSIQVRQAQFQQLQVDSIIETHQIFAIILDDFTKKRLAPLGFLPKHVLDDVLAGCARLFMPPGPGSPTANIP